MRMGFNLYQKLALECRVCRREIPADEEQRRVELALFGAKKYSYCVGCYLPVEEPLSSDRNYRARWDRAFKRKVWESRGTFEKVARAAQEGHLKEP